MGLEQQDGDYGDVQDMCGGRSAGTEPLLLAASSSESGEQAMRDRPHAQEMTRSEPNGHVGQIVREISSTTAKCSDGNYPA